MNSIDQPILERIRKETLVALETFVDVSKPVALLDVPVHRNVGDFMIVAGQKAYLRRLGVKTRYISDVGRFEPRLLRKRMPEGTVLLTGGGNFGDTWPDHQAFKERVLEELPDYRIVQLPQSIFFKEERNSARANSLLSRHSQFTLMVRDAASLDRAKRELPDLNTVYVPDMALGWSPTPYAEGQPGGSRTVVLARTDRESTRSLVEQVRPLLGESDTVVDWNMTLSERIKYSIGKIPGKISNGGNEERKRHFLYPLIERGYDLVLSQNLASGVRTFADASLVVTDRLHAFVLATLMGIPSIALDNSYGKVRALYDDYLSLFSTAHFAGSEADLVRLYQEIRQA